MAYTQTFCKSQFINYFNSNNDLLGSRLVTDSLVLPVMYKENYDFLGWSDENNVFANAKSVFTSTTNLYSKFSPKNNDTFTEIFNINSQESAKHLINKNISSDTYITIEYETDQPIKGEFHFKEGSTLTSDEFFLDKNDTKFSIYLDVYRKNSALSKCNRILEDISYKNVGKEKAHLEIKKITHSGKDYLLQDDYSISDTHLKAGIKISLGGGLSLLQNLDKSSVEYIDTNGEIKIRTRDKISNVSKEIASNPNLINVYDHGREIQQSYYMNVDESNGYERSEYLGKLARYNPVQSGDQNLSESRIIDFSIETNKIWVKVQSVDWAKNNVLTKSYMTNTYTIKDGLLYVDNSFVDWYGFTNYDEHDGEIELSNGANYVQELPAVYLVHPLNYFSTKLTDGSSSKEIFDNNGGWNTSLDGVENKTSINKLNQLDIQNSDGSYRPSLSAGSYYYAVRKHNENWVGYLNEDKFGVVMYMCANKYNHSSGSNRHIYVGGTLNRNHNVSESKNRSYYNATGTRVTMSSTQYRNNPIESSKIDNTTYISTMLALVIKEYCKFSWSYALGADYLSTLTDKFYTLQANGELQNDFTSMTGGAI